MTKHLRQYGLAALFAMVLLAAVPASGGDGNEAPPGGSTLTPVDHNPFAPDWNHVSAKVENARISACLALSAIVLQGPQIMGERAKLTEFPILYTEKYIEITARLLQLLDKHCEVAEP